ncbi:MAG: hypothetical protein LBK29_02275 [Oscillospiraceae bacterium]|jgi:hypothetical protein|nr:hypothetical protein [Oscillospiraceae bacterium]
MFKKRLSRFFKLILVFIFLVSCFNYQIEPVRAAQESSNPFPKNIFAMPEDLDTTWTSNRSGDVGIPQNPGGSNQYIYLGEYPKTLITDSDIINQLKKFPVRSGETVEYNGEKYVFISTEEKNVFFKIEPIQWRILHKTETGVVLQTEQIIDSGLQFKDDGGQHGPVPAAKIENYYANNAPGFTIPGTGYYNGYSYFLKNKSGGYDLVLDIGKNSSTRGVCCDEKGENVRGVKEYIWDSSGNATLYYNSYLEENTGLKQGKGWAGAELGMFINSEEIAHLINSGYGVYNNLGHRYSRGLNASDLLKEKSLAIIEEKGWAEAVFQGGGYIHAQPGLSPPYTIDTINWHAFEPSIPLPRTKYEDGYINSGVSSALSYTMPKENNNLSIGGLISKTKFWLPTMNWTGDNSGIGVQDPKCGYLQEDFEADPPIGLTDVARQKVETGYAEFWMDYARDHRNYGLPADLPPNVWWTSAEGGGGIENSFNHKAWVVKGDGSTAQFSYNQWAGIAPACELNLEKVAFASANSTSEVEGYVQISGLPTMTLRLKGQENEKPFSNWNGQLVKKENKISYTQAPEDSKLVVIGINDGNVFEHSQSVSGDGSLELPEFQNFKAWLEKKDSQDNLIYATAFASEGEIKFMPAFDQTDENTNLRVTASEGVFPEDAQLKVRKLTGGEVLELADNPEDIEHILPYDIQIWNQDETEQISIPQGKKAKVSIPITNEDWDKPDTKAVYLKSGPDKELDVTFTTLNGEPHANFEVEHFTPYALIDVLTTEEKKGINEKIDTGKDIGNPKTGTTNRAAITITYGIAISILLAAFLVIVRKMKKNEGFYMT